MQVRCDDKDCVAIASAEVRWVDTGDGNLVSVWLPPDTWNRADAGYKAGEQKHYCEFHQKPALNLSDTWV